MKRFFVLCFLIGLYSCGSKSELSEAMQCKPKLYANLELVRDVDKRFIVEIPKHWKTNLYFDKNQTSIFSADTTKQLTDSYTFDVTYIYEELQIDQKFLERFKRNLTKNNLVESTSYELTFNEQEAYYSRALGKRGAFDYEILNLFIKANPNSYLHVKTEFYGDSLVNQRICNALSLIEKIQY
jgi:hypothetical protein